jgi:hypothetical protein
MESVNDFVEMWLAAGSEYWRFKEGGHDYEK